MAAPVSVAGARPDAAAVRGRAGLRLLGDGLRISRRAAVLLSVWSLLSAAPALVSGKALAEAVDRGFLARDAGAAALWLGVSAAVTVAGAWAGRQTYPPLADIIEPLRDRLLRGVVSGTLRRAAQSGAPRSNAAAVAVAQITRQVEAVRDAASGQLLIVWQFALTAVAVLLGTAALAPAAAVLVAAPLVLALCLFGLMLPTMVRRQRTAFLAEERLAHVAVDTLEALRDLIACGAQDRGAQDALQAVVAQAAATRSLARMAAVRRLIVALGAHVPMLLVLLAAPVLVRRGMTAGSVVGVLTYLAGVLEPALRLLVQGVGGSFMRLDVAASRLAQAAGTAEPERKSESEQKSESEAESESESEATQYSVSQVGAPDVSKPPSVALHRVTFAYGPGAEPVLRELSLTVAAGEHLAVVGPSGIGKSTLAALIAGVVLPDSGLVALGGVALAPIAADRLHRLRVLLPQEAYVFAGTLRENIGYLAPEADDRVLRQAADRLGLAGLLARPGGLDATVDPAGLSAGEKQQIALARAYASPAGLVLLDEATSRLDPAAEARAELAFHERPGTVVTVAHRISSARRADRILLLDGTAARIGTHESLLADSPLYADLVGHWAAPTESAAGATRQA